MPVGTLDTVRREVRRERPKGNGRGEEPLSLDATQQMLITKLEASRESWQQSGTYDPEQYQEPAAVRRRKGAALRKVLPHAAHGSWKPPKNRPSPVDIVVAGNVDRQQQLVPLRMARMSASPFAFLRGAASVMAWDLTHTPVTGIQVLINGDAHINNFGLFGSLQRDVIIDVNDFDEATLGALGVGPEAVGGQRQRGGTRKRYDPARATHRGDGSRRGLSLQRDAPVDDGCARCVVPLRACGTPSEDDQGSQEGVGIDPEVVTKAKAAANASLLAKVAQRRGAAQITD